MSYLLGIDVGTTRTAAAICQLHDGRPGETEMVSLGDRSTDVPSVLFIGADGGVVVGEAAERRALTDPDRVVREFKRRVGDPTPVVAAGRVFAAEELSARLVRWVVDRVAEREGGAAARIAVTRPASWGAHKTELFAAALGGQGLAVAFLAEPQAAALHYAGAERVEAGSAIAVYDLGGGTFDAAVVRKDPAGVSGSFGLLGRPEGLARLGGVDFDEVVFEHVRAGLPGVFEGLDESDPAVLAAVARVRRECTEAKEALSSDTEVTVAVLLPGSRGSVRLHRSEFEALISAKVGETVTALRRAVESAGLTPAQLSAVLLVGGSSRIPLVAQLVSEQLGRPVAVDADPKNAIARGAVLALTPPRSPAAAGFGPRRTGGSATVPSSSRQGPAAAKFRPPGVPAPLPPPRGGLGPAVPTRGPARAAPAAGLLAGGRGAAADRNPAADEPFHARPRDAAPGLVRVQPDDGLSRRTPVFPVAAGGVVAVLGVLAAVLLWPHDSTASSATTRIEPSLLAPASAPRTSAATPPTAQAPVVNPGSGAGPTAPTTTVPAPAPPPVVVTTTPVPQPTTTPSPPSPTPPASSSSTTSSSAPPASSSSAASSSAAAP